MKANFSGVTTARTQTESRSEWQKRDEARKREIERNRADNELSDMIMDYMGGEIAEMRQPHGLRVVIEPWEAYLILQKGGIVNASAGGRRERCWLAKDGTMWAGMIPAKLANIDKYDTEIWIYGKGE